jgi:hypothetical protein
VGEQKIPLIVCGKTSTLEWNFFETQFFVEEDVAIQIWFYYYNILNTICFLTNEMWNRLIDMFPHPCYDEVNLFVFFFEHVIQCHNVQPFVNNFDTISIFSLFKQT